MKTPFRLVVLTAALACLAGIPASAGTIALTWDPVTDPNLAGYRVYYGTASGNYTQSLDVGNTTSTTIQGVTDCTTWYMAVKAYNTSGTESTTYSNEISGWPRPVITSVAPNAAEQGRTLSLTVTGSNFQTGATVEFGNTGITVNSVSVSSCTQLTVNVTVQNAAAAGATNVDVLNPDVVFGSLAAGFTVQAQAAPTVQSTAPADGATGVSVSVKPTVTFSEAMLASSITSSNVKLLNGSGVAVAQAAGSPSLSADGLTATITPAQNLTQGVTYKIQVVGGAAGVLDLANHGMSSTYTQTTGFGTTADTTPPVISAVASSGVGSTAATITWTTDENADSQVFYRKSGDTEYQQTLVDTNRVTSHSVTLQGLTPSTTYEYNVRSADAAGNASTSSPNKTFTTTANAFTYLRFETESGMLTAPARVSTGAGTFQSSYIDTPTGAGQGTPTAPIGTAVYGINVPSAGTWYLWVRMYGGSTSSDQWFESINGASRQAFGPTQTGQWQWVAGRSYTLAAGLASLELGGDDPQARVDRVLLTDDASFVPTEQPVGDQTAPAPVSALASAAGDAQVTLTWTNPASADLAKVVIRYRTDGKAPVSPVDGLSATEKTAAAGAADSYLHTGLTNGTTYTYGVFAVDAAGNVSDVATTSATPKKNTPPPSSPTNVRRADKKR